MPNSFNVLIATIGRPTLQRMLNSLYPQLDAIDCLTIVFDGHATPPVFDVSNFKCKVNQYCEPVPLGFFGHGIRNKYASILEKRDFVMHADDDDIYLEDSFYNLRKMIGCNNTLYITAMIYNNALIIPRSKYIYVGNIGTPNGIIPYKLNLIGKWNHYYGGDGEFYLTISKLAKKTEFLNIIIYRIRP
jgi:hypothetical protein